MDICFSPCPLTSVERLSGKSPGDTQNLEEGQEYQAENLLALKVSLSFSTLHFLSNSHLRWDIHVTEHCKKICLNITFKHLFEKPVQKFFHTCWIVGLWVLHWRCVAAVLRKGSGDGLSPLLKWQRRGHRLESVCNLCWKPLEYWKGNPFIWKSWGSLMPWKQPKRRTLPCSGRDWSPI